GQFMVVIFLSIYWSLDKVHFERLWLSLLPPQNRRKAREIWSGIEKGVGSYFRSEMIQSLVVGLLLGFGFWLIGIRYPTILAIIGAVAWLIPYIGPLIAIIPVFVIGITVNLATALIASIFTIVILVLMQMFVEPLFFRRKDYSALLTVLVLILLADMFGLIGFLIAPPLAAAIQILLRNLLGQTSAPTIANVKISTVEHELDMVEDILRKQKTSASKQFTKLTLELKEIAKKAKELENS
ncbi:MAG: AI-2E family transporter, partial [Anaerolineaceae bacterium]|nr:AI-2E family transporter [Anaerolineaceae bacterium]